MTSAARALTGQEVVSGGKAGDDFLSIDSQFLVLGMFFEAESVRPVSHLLTWTLSPGSQAVILGLLVPRGLLGKGGVGLS